MLKNHGPIRHVTLPFAARVSTVAVLVAIGLLIAGLRGPAGGSAALAQERLAAARAADADSYELAYLPADTRMMLVLRPQSLLRRGDVKSLLTSLRDNPMLLAGMPFKPEDVGQAIYFWETEDHAGVPRSPNPLAPSGFVLQMTKPQEWKPLMTHLGGPELKQAQHAGQMYYRSDGGGGGSWAFYFPNDQTLVAAREVVLREIIADRNAPAERHAWDEVWRKVGKGQVMMAVDTRWVRRKLAPIATGPGEAARGLAMFAPLYEKAQSYALSIDATDRSLAVDAVAAVQGPDNAKAVSETLQAIVTLGKNALQNLGRDGRRQPPVGEAEEWALEAAGSVVAKARVETTDGFVRLHSESAVDLAEGIRLVAPAVVKAKADANRYQSVNNLKQIGLAFHNFASTTKNTHFPASANRDKGKFPYSWRVAILPFIEQPELYNQYHFDEPWDGPNNRKLIDQMPAIYAYPGPDGRPTSRSHTSYFVFNGPRTIGGDEDGTQLAQITDGTSNTLLAVEAKREVPWTKPEDIPFDPNGPPPELGGFTPDGFNALFADGSVRYIKKTVAPQVLKALITRDGGEVLSTDSF
jgi:prepilin-type processing-associated H-X9-DG protein